MVAGMGSVPGKVNGDKTQMKGTSTLTKTPALYKTKKITNRQTTTTKKQADECDVA